MWECPKCNQQFKHKNQNHSCNEKSVGDFLQGKSEHVVELFHFFISEYMEMGEFVLHPAKSRIAFAAKTRFGYIHRLGKDFLDVVFTFDKPHEDNFCFYRIGKVPGGKIYQHYLRIIDKTDLNEEVRHYMKLALDNGSKI